MLSESSSQLSQSVSYLSRSRKFKKMESTDSKSPPSPPPPNSTPPASPTLMPIQQHIPFDLNQKPIAKVFSPNGLNWYQPVEVIGFSPSGSPVYKALFHAFGGFKPVFVAMSRVKNKTHLEFLKTVGKINQCRSVYHPLMVSFKEEVLDGNQDLWIVFEFVGRSIRSFFPNGCRLSVAAYCLAATLKVLVAVHQEGFVHGLINTGHLYFFQNHPRTVKIGFAATVYDETEVLADFHPCPELFYHGATYDSRSDIWQIGIMGLELVLGKFGVSNRQELEALIECALSEQSDYQNHFKNFLRRCLNENPVMRPTAEELLQDAFFKKNLPGAWGNR